MNSGFILQTDTGFYCDDLLHCNCPSQAVTDVMVLFTVKLIMYGEFTSVTNSSNPQQPAQMDFTIETTVHSVLRNDDNIDVSSSIIIKDHENPCHKHLANIRTGVQVVCISVYYKQGHMQSFLQFWLFLLVQMIT